MDTHTRGRARRSAPSLHSTHRVVSMVTLMFFLFSMLGPLTVRTAFAEGEVVDPGQATEIVPAEEAAPVDVVPAEEPAAPAESAPAPEVQPEQPAVPLESAPAPAPEQTVLEQPAQVPAAEEPVIQESAAEELLNSDAPADMTVAVSEELAVVTDVNEVSCVAAEGAAPWIASDLADYPPGSLVILSGGGWLPGQDVQIFIDDDGAADDIMGPWSHSTVVIADAAGSISYQFNIADWFVASYFVTATGECSTATTTFTDGNVHFAVNGPEGVHSFPYTVYEKSNCTGKVEKSSSVPARTNVATANSGSIEFTAPGTISGWTFQGWNIGTVSGTKTCINGQNNEQTATATYRSPVQPATVALGNLAHTYDGTAKAATVGTTPSGISGVTITYTQNGQPVVNPTNAGTYDVTASLNNPMYTADPVTGTLTIAPRPITVTADAKTMFFGGAEPALTYTVTGGSLVGADAFTGSLARNTGTDVGEYNITQHTLALNSNYILSFVGATLTIDPAHVAFSIEDTTVPYDGNPHAASVTGTPLGATVHVTYNGKSEIPVGAGRYEVVATLTDNYSGTATGTLVIDKANQTITFGALSDKTFGDAPFTVSATGGASGNPVTFATSGACTIDGDTVAITAAGSCAITASQAGNDNYNAAMSVSQPFNITKATATITLTVPTELVYDGTAKFATATSDAVGSPEVTITYFQGQDANRSEVASPTNAGSYDVVATLSGLDNYDDAEATGTLTIARRPASVTPNPSSKVYGAEEPVLGGTLEGFIVADSITASYIREEGSNVGSYTITAALSAADDVLDNYGVIYNTATFTIKQADQATLTVSGPEKGTYSDVLDLSVAGGSGTGIVTFTASGTACEIPSEGDNAGKLVITSGTGDCSITATKAADTNYKEAVSAPLLVTIAKAPLNLTLSHLTHTYDGTIKFASVSGAPEDVNVAITYTDEDDEPVDEPVNAGTYNVTATLDNPNYAAKAATGQLVIDPAGQTIMFDALQDKTFGDEAFTVSATTSSGLDVSFSSTGNCTVADSTVTITGAGKCTIMASQAGNPNYKAAPDVEQTFEIGQATATITLNSDDLKQTYNKNAKSVRFTANPASIAGEVVVTYWQGATEVTAPTNAGEYTVKATLSGNTNYTDVTETGILVIAKADQTVTFSATPPANMEFGNTYRVNATSTGDGTITFATNNDAICKVSEGVVTMTGNGTCTVTASASETGNYKSHTESQAFTVHAKIEIKGFYQPVDMGNVANTVKGGSTVPLKFEVYVNGKEVRDLQTVTIKLTGTKVACNSSAAPDEIEVTATGGTSLRFDTSGDQFVYNWQTPKGAGSCYTVTVTVSSGTTVTFTETKTLTATVKTK